MTVTQFCVVDGSDGNLIGYETAVDLGLLHIRNSVSTPKVTNMLEDYNDCFEGLGKMKGKTAKLHIDDSVKPLAQKYRRLPFHIRDQVEANQAIERERHPVPTVEDLIVDLNGATVFSKIDLNQGRHKLELDEESRSITTFATHIGLFRYK